MQTILLYVGILFLMFLYPAAFALTSIKVCSEKIVVKGKSVYPPIPLPQYLASCCPLVQIMVTHKAYYNKYGWTAPVVALVPILIAFRLLVVFMFPENVLLLIISSCGSILAVLLFWFLYAATYIDVAVMFGIGSWIYYIITVIMPFGAVWYLNEKLPKEVAALRGDLMDGVPD